MSVSDLPLPRRLRPSRLREIAPTLLFVLLGVAACATTTVIALSATATGDYEVNGPVGGDNVAPALMALIHGDLARYVSHQPAIGLTSLLLRVPFAGITSLLGAGTLDTYRVGAAACLLPLGLFAAWLAARRRSPTLGWVPGLAAGILLLLSPAVPYAVQSGHPAEVLAAVLATSAVIAATQGHARAAAVMLGLAIGTKPWAAMAAAPVLVALPGQRGRTLVIAGALAFGLAAVAPLADPAAFVRSLRGEGTQHLVNALSFWWPVSSPVHLASGVFFPTRTLPFGMDRSAASLISAVAALLLLTLAWAHSRRRGRTCDALALLALLGVLRCTADSTHLEYYYLAALIPLIAWEAVALGRVPVLGAIATVAVALIPGGEAHVAPALLSTAWSVGPAVLICVLTQHAFGLGKLGRGPRGTSSGREFPRADPIEPRLVQALSSSDRKCPDLAGHP